MGQSLVNELQQARVCVDHDLFQVVPNTSTAFTTIIVSSQEHTRTCLHTPGTCGEWTWDEMITRSNIPWQNVCHFHSDARHTDAALYLTRQAKRRGIPMSLDVEKDRGSTALDEMLELADIIFTNALQLRDYLQRLTMEWEAKEQLKPLKIPTICNRSSLSDSLARDFIRAVEPSSYFARRYHSIGKQIVITKGHLGSIHVECESIDATDSGIGGGTGEMDHQLTLEDCKGSHESRNHTFRVKQVFSEQGPASTRRVQVVYKMNAVGILPNISIVDTTGAGDAFLGGYLAAKLEPHTYPYVVDCLRFATWVAGQKIQGSGARTTLPTACMREKELGTEDPAAVLRGLITAFGETS